MSEQGFRSTAWDVAEKAGVSQSTVSRVFTGSTRISEATRDRVLAAAKELAGTLGSLFRNAFGADRDMCTDISDPTPSATASVQATAPVAAAEAPAETRPRAPKQRQSQQHSQLRHFQQRRLAVPSQTYSRRLRVCPQAGHTTANVGVDVLSPAPVLAKPACSASPESQQFDL